MPNGRGSNNNKQRNKILMKLRGNFAARMVLCQVSEPLNARYGWVLDDPPYEIQPILQQSGLHRLLDLKDIHVDRGLISALVERWRPETHTFHFPYGECTVTLEDVAMLFGLRVDGEPLTGMVPCNIEQVTSMCQQLLGRVPEDHDFKKNSIGIDWLKEHYGSTLRTDPVDVDQITVMHWHAHGYLLRLLGVIVFPDKSKEVVHPKYLGVLPDLGQMQSYSWGSACLAFLYRALCRATRVGSKQIDGALMLLQAWAWFRLPFLAPMPNYRLVVPLATRWNGAAHGDDYPKTRTTYWRGLDRMGPYDFVWQPYQSSNVQVQSYTGCTWVLGLDALLSSLGAGPSTTHDAHGVAGGPSTTHDSHGVAGGPSTSHGAHDIYRDSSTSHETDEEFDKQMEAVYQRDEDNIWDRLSQSQERAQREAASTERRRSMGWKTLGLAYWAGRLRTTLERKAPDKWEGSGRKQRK